MKVKRMNSRTFFCLLFSSLMSSSYAGTMGEIPHATLGKIYVGAFGGGGSLSSGNYSQHGTSFYPEDEGGPLAVNAVGSAANKSEWLVGGHVGYKWPTRVLNNINSSWSFAPATELEGYYIGGVTLSADDKDNDTTRIDEHYFHVTYPLRTGVFLINSVLNVDHPSLDKFHPYVGVGIGAAVLAISGANSAQKTPAEPGINHYNSNASDTSIAFAAQPKIGMAFDITPSASLFVEYRFLYLSASSYTFGSTVYPTHKVTSDWDVKIGSQYYNMGTIGVHYDL
ncbi:MAG: hypothetical protein Q8R83_03090 [Legionellaceae bacterium]|nr:hypothetical protein [Legionellaceae bacterium]